MSLLWLLQLGTDMKLSVKALALEWMSVRRCDLEGLLYIDGGCGSLAAGGREFCLRFEEWSFHTL